MTLTIITSRPNLLGERGFLRNWPDDVVYVVNGEPVTKSDILQAKRERQRKRLEEKLRNREPVIKPCFVWTFYNSGFPFGGWWLYVKTTKHSWQIDTRGIYSRFILEIMRLFPCGYLPLIENFSPWKEAFAHLYHYPTSKRPQNHGMALAWATIEGNWRLTDINLQPLTEDQ